jgi:prenyl protein peptidase
MGFPRFWGRLSAAESVLGSDVGSDKRSEHGNPRISSRELSVMWTIAYYILLVLGAFGWWKLLWVLTESASKLADLKQD